VLLAVTAAAWFVITKKLTALQADCEVVVTEQVKDESSHGTSWGKLLSYSSAILFLACLTCGFAKSLYDDWAIPVLDGAFPWLGNSVAKTITIAVPMIAIFGTFFARWLFNRIQNPFFSYLVLCSMLTALTLVMSIAFESNVVLTVGLFVLIAFCVTAVNNTCTSIIPLNMRRYGKSGGIAGIINAFCHIGATIGSVLLGAVSDSSGWSSMFVVACAVCAFMAVCSVVGALYWKKHVARTVHLG
jgi:sugar phosphate permease